MDEIGDSVLVPRRGRAGLVILVAALVSVGTVLGLQAGAARWGKSVVPVPVLVGLSEVEARGAVESLGMVFVIIGTIPDAVVAKGGVADQTPFAGTAVAPGTVVHVKLSSGLPGALPTAQPLAPAPAVPPPRPGQAAVPPVAPAAVRPSAPAVPAGPTVSVPKVVGVRLQFATSRLQSAGLTVGRLSYEADEDHIESFVLRQTPAAGNPAPRGSAVDLVVNKLE